MKITKNETHYLVQLTEKEINAIDNMLTQYIYLHGDFSMSYEKKIETRFGFLMYKAEEEFKTKG